MRDQSLITSNPNPMFNNSNNNTNSATTTNPPTNQSNAPNGAKHNTPVPECFGCHKVIRERYLLKALDHLWHEDCLKCACCDCRLGEVGSTLFTKANLILCKRDYLRLFGTTGLCSACHKTIPAFEMVMRAKGNVYHLECFACMQCNQKFCVGDRFYLFENKILCEFDYDERMTFSDFSQTINSSLDHIKQQVERLSDGNNSCGSPGR